MGFGGAASPKGLIMLRHRLECETGARDFFAAATGERRRSADGADGLLPSPAAALPPALLEKHLAAVSSWFASNLSLLRRSRGATAPAALGEPTLRALEKQYEQLFFTYRADLQAALLASPAAQQMLLARLQWPCKA